MGRRRGRKEGWRRTNTETHMRESLVNMYCKQNVRIPHNVCVFASILCFNKTASFIQPEIKVFTLQRGSIEGWRDRERKRRRDKTTAGRRDT